ncbi:MAG: acylphosphatase [Deltaproteobacteria bacterium]|nr:acylphosphatase [Deltaproteobacteria bacterium]
MGNSKERVTIVVHGKVQGVFFRKHTLEKAQSLLLTGYVRNTGNGSVTIVAEGPSDDLRALAAWCQKGPPLAEVASVDTTFEPAQNEYTSFRIRYDEGESQGGIG